MARSIKNPGIFAADAQTTIPPTPVVGISYRDAATGLADIKNGWPFKTIVSSEDFNQILHEITSLTDLIDRTGILEYKDDVEYDIVPAYAQGSDGNIYKSTGANGPATTVVDPVGDLTGVWVLALTNYADIKSSRINLLDNAAFRFNERGYISGTATTIADQFTLDRWRVVVSGQNVTFGALGTDNTVTCPAGGFATTVKPLDVFGGDYVISWVGTATCTVDGTPRTNGESFTLTANTKSVISFSGGTLKQPQLEGGTVKTNFEAVPQSVDLARCKFHGRRYVSGYIAGHSVAVTSARFSLPLGDGMYSAPVLTLVVANGTASDFQGTNIAVTSLVSSGNTTEFVRLIATVAAGLIAGNASQMIIGDFFLESEII